MLIHGANRGVKPSALKSFIESTSLKYRDGARSYIFECPRCRKADKLYIRKSDGRFICWVCAEIDNYKGWAELPLRDLTGLSLGVIKEALYGSSGADSQGPWINVNLRDFFSEADEERSDYTQTEALQERKWPVDYYDLTALCSKRGLGYLNNRGISLELAQYYQLKYDPRGSRVVFPVSYQNKLYGWQARYIHDTEGVNEESGREWKIPKILSSDSLVSARNQIVMFADQLTGTDQAIISEGPIDAIKCHLCHQSGKTAGNIATMGKVVDRNQLAFIRNAGVNKIYLALDPDAAAEVGRIASEFNDLEVFLMKPQPGYEDFGAMPVEAVPECWRNAEKYKPGRMNVYLDPEMVPTN